MSERNRGHHHHHHHIALSYPVSFGSRVYALVLGPIAFVGLLALMTYFYPVIAPQGEVLTFFTILQASFATCFRLAIAYVIAAALAVPLSLFVTMNPTVEAIFLPVFDVLESVPILVLFPVLVVLFVSTGFLNGAAITILFITMLWSIVFTLVGGIKIIPKDILYAGQIFGLKGWPFTRKVILPAIVPQFVTGSILAVAQGWNIIIVAEVLHTYLPGGTSAQDLFGIGSILVNASAQAQTKVFLMAVFVMVVIIAFFNFFVWQRLLHYAQRFRFE
jgi:NitT/TauT family transport system permease protein